MGQNRRRKENAGETNGNEIDINDLILPKTNHNIDKYLGQLR